MLDFGVTGPAGILLCVYVIFSAFVLSNFFIGLFVEQLLKSGAADDELMSELKTDLWTRISSAKDALVERGIIREGDESISWSQVWTAFNEIPDMEEVLKLNFGD